MKKNHRYLKGTLVLFAAVLPAHADLFWDGTELTADADGRAGVWDTTTANWDTLATGGADTIWSNTENAIFGGSSGIVSIAAGGITAANVSFTTDGYTVKDNTLAVGAGAITTAPGVGATVSSAITGTAGLSKAGAGTLTLAGLSTYTGSTKITAGTLKLSPISSSYRYYRFTFPVNYGNGTNAQDGYNQIGELHYYKAGVWTAATAGSASGPGTGEQLWSNANDNKGANVAGFTKYGFGTRPISINYDFGAPTSFDSYNWSSANDSTPARNPRRWTVFGSNDNVNFVAIDDRSNIDQAVGPTNTYTWAGATGTYLVNDNGVNGGAANAYPIIGGSGLPIASPLEIASGATFDLNGLSQTTPSLADLSGGGGLITNSAATLKSVLTFGSASNTGFSGTISDSGVAGSLSLVKVGAGTQTLSGASSNTYSGNTVLGGNGKLLLAKTGGAIAIPGNIELGSTAFGGNNAGLVLGGDEQIADTAIVSWSYVAFGGGGQADTFFRLNGRTETIGGLVTFNTSGLSAVENRGNNDATAFGNGNLILNVTGANSFTYNGQIRDTDASVNGLGGKIALTKTGTGTQILAGTMTGCTGPAVVNGGVLRLNNTLAAATLTVTGSGTLQGTGSASGLVTVESGGILSPGVGAAGTFTCTNPVTIGNAGTLVPSAGTTLGGAVVVGSGGLLTGAGTVSGAVTIQAGGQLTPGVSAIATLNTNNLLNLAGNATFEINKTGATLTNDKVNGFSKVTYGGTLTIVATGDTPVLGDSFQLFVPGAGGTYAGAFTGITGLPALPGGLQWETTTLLTTGRINVVDKASTPAFSPGAGGYVGAQSVSITSDSGSTIYYTVDGTDPTVASTSGSSPITGITIPVDSVVTVKAYASTPGFTDSAIATAVYRTVTAPNWVVDAAGTWSTAANWQNQVIPSGIGFTANFAFPLTANRIVTLDSPRTVSGLSFVNTGASTWTLSGSTLTLAVPSGSPTIDTQTTGITTTVSSILAGTQGLTKIGPGTLTLSGSNTYGGVTSINAGRLSVATIAANGANSPLGSGTTLSINGGTLVYTGGSVNFGTFNRNVTLGASGGTIDTTAAAGFIFTSGPFSGPGSLTKVGTRQLIIQSSNTYDGDTFVTAGEVQVRTVDALGSTVGKTVVSSGAQLAIGQNLVATMNEAVDLNGQGNGNGALQDNDGGTVVTWAGPISLVTDSGIGGASNFTISGAISGPGILTKQTTNAITLSGASSNTYGGGTILSGSGKLVLAKTGGALAIPGNINMASSASNANGNNSGIVLANNEQIADGAVLTWTTTSNTYLRLNGFTETIGGLVAATATPGAPAIENRGFGDALAYPNGSLVINTTGASSYSYTGVIRDTDPNVAGFGLMTLTKAGTGTQALNGTLTYTGATTITGGTLVIGSAFASPITVQTGGTLKGTGSSTKALTVNAGGTVAPGTSAGTFTAASTIIAGSYACEVDGATADRLTVNGDLDITGATLDFTTLNAPTAPSYVLASYTGTLTGTFTVTGLPTGYVFIYDSGAKQIKLVKIGFAGYAATNGLSGNPSADFDGDGLVDAVEYVLGTSPTTASVVGAPALSLVGGDLVFTFTRVHSSMTPDTAVAVEVGTDLTIWPGVYDVGVDTASSDAGITVTDNGSNDTITLTVPVGTDTSKYARLKVTVTP